MVLSCCFGHGALKEIEELPTTQMSIRIGNRIDLQLYDSLIPLFILSPVKVGLFAFAEFDKMLKLDFPYSFYANYE